MDTLDNLLHRYFEGQTSAEEERRLRAFFASGEVPPQWAVYRPLFAYFDEASQALAREEESVFSDEEQMDGIPRPEALLETAAERREGADVGGFQAKSERKEVENDRSTAANSHRLFYLIAGIAASVLVMLTTYRVWHPSDPCFCSDNYVVINGRCYTDIHKVRSLALEALQEVATPAEAYFPAPDDGLSDREIIDDQLKEFSTLFNE